MNRIAGLILLIATAFNTGCSEYQKVLKSTDADYKYNKALEYYNNEKYNKAYPLFDELLTLYRGSQKAAEVYYYYAYTNFHLKDFILAAYHFKKFVKTFPNHKKAEESAYMIGYCYYLESPKHNLDQTYTYKAINELQLFVNKYPSSDKLYNTNELIEDLRGKLEQKAFEKAKLYFNMEDYKAAVVALNNVLNQYPDTKYRERVYYFRLLATYRLAKNSVEKKKLQRFIESRTAYQEFVETYPESEYLSNADGYISDIKSNIQELKRQS